MRELKDKHGQDFEKWWRTRFGHAFTWLAQSEAQSSPTPPDVDAIRVDLLRHGAKENRAGDAGSVQEQNRRIRELTSQTCRSRCGRSLAMGSNLATASALIRLNTPHTKFDLHAVVLTVSGRRESLLATLKLAIALRG